MQPEHAASDERRERVVTATSLLLDEISPLLPGLLNALAHHGMGLPRVDAIVHARYWCIRRLLVGVPFVLLDSLRLCCCVALVSSVDGSKVYLTDT